MRLSFHHHFVMLLNGEWLAEAATEAWDFHVFLLAFRIILVLL
jgi:hypothetical protein